MQTSGNRCEITIGAVEGHCNALPTERSYEIRLERTSKPSKVLVDGNEANDWGYDAQTATTTLNLPPQSKSQPLQLAIIAENAIPVGDNFDQQLIQADVKRLLGNQTPAVEDAKMLEAVLALPDSAARMDALARLGAPFASVVEYTTPDEAAQHFGCLVIAAPADGSEFSGTVNWTLFAKGDKTTQTQTFASTTEAQLIYSPFKFENEIFTAFWTAEVNLQWRGTTVSFSYQSQAIFPAIPKWQTVIYNQNEQQLQLAEVVDAKNELNPNLTWETFTQEVTTLQNVREPFQVRFHDRHKPRLKAGESLAAYAISQITSPDEREVSIAYWANGEIEFYLNGVAIAEAAESPKDVTFLSIAYTLLGPRRTVTVKLKAGVNTLIADTKSALPNVWWVYRASLVRPDGSSMTDLLYQ
jgi:hypothetical protein